jgi:hypothetical protein
MKTMKTLKLAPLFLIAVLFCSYTAIAQEEEEMIEEVQDEQIVMTGVFKGLVDGTYNFFNKEDVEDGEINFDKIIPEILKGFNLNNSSLVGKTFEVTYTNVNEEEEDDEGDIMYTSVKTIIKLKQIK